MKVKGHYRNQVHYHSLNKWDNQLKVLIKILDIFLSSLLCINISVMIVSSLTYCYTNNSPSECWNLFLVIGCIIVFYLI
jgi:hypothetical protein